MDKKQVVVREMPVDLWRKVKICAAVEDVTIQVIVAKAITQYLAKSA